MMKRFGFNEYSGFFEWANTYVFEEKILHGGVDDEHHLLAFGEDSNTCRV